ncbi:ABC transporter permease, partial [Bordetella avium]
PPPPNPGAVAPAPPVTDRLSWVRAIGQAIFDAAHNGIMLLRMLGQLVLDFIGLLLRPSRGPWREISAQIYRTGAQALGITALVGFLIGVVLSYLSAQQLQMFGADRFIVRLLGVSIVRELGPVLAAILVAGRSGSAITAQIGVMRVTQELDAMSVMGISQSQRLILPRVVALAITMPLLVLWTDAMALLGGMLAAQMQLGISAQWFLESLPNAVTITNYWIGMVKGVSFGVLIALVACHFGLRIKPDTESLGRGTTTSVVTSITGVILVDALYAVILSGMGI